MITLRCERGLRFSSEDETMFEVGFEQMNSGNDLRDILKITCALETTEYTYET